MNIKLYPFSLISQNRTFIMGLAMISIMLFHQHQLNNGLFFHGFHNFGHWGVDFFIFLSGFGIASSLQKGSIKSFYIRRIKRIFPTCLFIGLISLLLFLYTYSPEHPNGIIHLMSISYTEKLILIPFSLNKWYIDAILFYYLLAPFFKKVNYNYGYYFIALLVIFSLFSILIPLPYYLGWPLERTATFAFGMYFFEFRQNYTLTSKKILFFIILFLFALCLSIFNVTFLHRITYLYMIILFTLPTLCSLLSQIRYLLERLHLSFIKDLINWFGKYSLELYLWHETILNICDFFPPKWAWLNLLIGIIVSCILSFFTKKIINTLMSRLHLTSH